MAHQFSYRWADGRLSAMVNDPSSSAGAERFGSRWLALLLLLSPVLLWAGQYFHQPELQHYYRSLLNLLPIFGPTVAMFWIAALLRIFWPDRLPGPLSRDSAHMRFAVRLGRGFFWAAGAAFAGAMLAACLGWSGKGRLGNPLGFVSCACMGAGFVLQEYVKFRREPGTRAQSLAEPGMVLILLPVLVLLGMMLIVSWDEPGWNIGLGGLLLLMLWIYVRLVRRMLARRRELRAMGANGGAASPTV
jgi:hypothetical protein